MSRSWVFVLCAVAGALVAGTVPAGAAPVLSDSAYAGGSPAVGVSAGPTGGWWIAHADGEVTAGGTAPALGSAASSPIAAPVVGMATTADHAGYWLVASDGGIFSFGDAAFFGSTGAMRLNRPVV